MIKKKTEITIHQGRSVSNFFRKNLEYFERKFDGFPAISLTPASVPAIQEGAEAYDNFNAEEIIDNIATAIVNSSGAIPPCPDEVIDPDGGCYPTGAGDCIPPDSGTTVKGTLIWTISDTFAAPTPVRYYTDVWYDDIMAVKDIDYTINDSNEIVPTSTLDSNTIVKARYVAI